VEGKEEERRNEKNIEKEEKESNHDIY